MSQKKNKPLFKDMDPPDPKKEQEEAARKEKAEKTGTIVEIALDIVETVVDILT